MSLENTILGEIKHTKDKYYGFHLYQVPRVVKFIEKESGIAVAMAWEKEVNKKLLFNEYRVSVWEDERSFEGGWW